MTMNQDVEALPALRHVFWIGGAPDASKTFVAIRKDTAATNRRSAG